MEDLSFDEVLTMLEDAFDAYVAPYSISRRNTNRLHLMYKADGAAYLWLNKVVLALSQRFMPSLCDDSDLIDIASIVGTSPYGGKTSAVIVTATNSDTAASHTLYAGTYQYVSTDSEVFSFTLDNDVLFDAGESVTYYAVSADTGSYAVTAVAPASIARSDNADIDNALTFACLDNTPYLGYAAETNLAFRSRILDTTDRDDLIVELETAIKALPTIYDCNCVFNGESTSATYDGITLAPKELLISISGVATDDMAKLVAIYGYFQTHIVDPSLVVYYDNSLYINGSYPVYYKNYDYTSYTLAVTFSYDSSKIKIAQVTTGLGALLSSLETANVHVDTVTEMDVYSLIDSSGLTSVTILNVDLFIAGLAVGYVSVPKTRLPQLASIAYTGIDTNEA